MRKNQHRLFRILFLVGGVLPLVAGILMVLATVAAGPAGIGPGLLAAMALPQGIACTTLFGAAWIVYTIVLKNIAKADALTAQPPTESNEIKSQIVVSDTAPSSPTPSPSPTDSLQPYTFLGKLLPALAVVSTFVIYLFLKASIDKSLLADFNRGSTSFTLAEGGVLVIFGFLE